MGSPPPTRGTRICYFAVHFCYRITPAYARNTNQYFDILLYYQDHPRLRGEHPHSSFAPAVCAGITPAYAGNTIKLNLVYLLLRDHPRLRGEHVSYYSWQNHYPGSPPPTRGTPTNALVDRYRNGITPAYAGNTVYKCI